MKKENKALLSKYITCFAVASLIAVAVFWSKGFFSHSVGVNIQILADGFFVSGILMTMLAGMLFVSSEGALIGIGFVLKSQVVAFSQIIMMVMLQHTSWSSLIRYPILAVSLVSIVVIKNFIKKLLTR